MRMDVGCGMARQDAECPRLKLRRARAHPHREPALVNLAVQTGSVMPSQHGGECGPDDGARTAAHDGQAADR